MHLVDWCILALFFVFTIWDGLRNSEKTSNIEGFFLAGRSIPWWAAGLSIMATHASAITFIGTTGQAYVEDMRFLQVYLGIPFAMVILSLTLVPFYRRIRNYSAYEVLEERFGLRTRLFTSLLFLISRGLALGTVIAAPAYVLALLLGMPLSLTILVIGVVATAYTMFGGMAGVIRTDIKQMAILMFGLLFSFGWILGNTPAGVSVGDSLYLAGTLDKLQALDLTFDVSEKYNVWSGVLAGIFLMLSYFGCDQTQVQRYLTARSVNDARGSLLLSAFAKVPMQFIILLLGVLLYVFYIFAPAPLTFRTVQTQHQSAEQQAEGARLHERYTAAHAEREQAALALLENRENPAARSEFLRRDAEVRNLRTLEFQRIEAVEKSAYNDTNYIIPYFILHEIPIGIIGLIIAGIFAAALSSIDSTLNSLSTVSVVDWYKRLHKQERSDRHYLQASRITTLLWGALATLAALALGETVSIIELVNKIGSYFYGSILGVFVLLLWVKRADATGAFYGLLLGMLAVFVGDSLYQHSTSGHFALDLPFVLIDSGGLHFGGALGSGFTKSIEYLWLNPLGTAVVVISGLLLRKRAG